MNLIKSITLGASLLVASICQAHITVYTAILSGPAEFPVNASPGIGSATITMDMDLITMRVQASFSGLEGNVTNAHIHAPTIVAGAGTAGVATRTPTFTGFPAGNTFGTYDQTFNMGDAASYNASFGQFE